jgi:phosphoglycolate phosphatase
MHTILFDIDGTLLRCGGAGLAAIGHAMEQLFGVKQLGKVTVHGRTDQGILNDLFEQSSLVFDDHRDEFNQKYWTKLTQTLGESPSYLLPGVPALLEQLATREDVALGVLTGNSERAAEVKLRHFNLDHFFHFGGFGDLHSNRNDVARLALESARSFLGDQFDASRLWVVGDTVNDIVCARAIDAKVVAVETGGASRSELEAAVPDSVLASLDDRSAFYKTLGLL